MRLAAFGRWSPLLAAIACSQSCAPATAPTPTPKEAPNAGAPPPGPSHLPPVPRVEGPIQITVVYPEQTDRVAAGDSSFMLGSVGTGNASLTINGAPVKVWPDGGWLAWLAFPPDSVIDFELVAKSPTDSASLIYPVRRVPRYTPPAAGVWIDSTSVVPWGRIWWPRDEYLSIGVRAAEMAMVEIRLADGQLLPLTAERMPAEVGAAVRAFGLDTAALVVPARADRYVGVIRGVTVNPSAEPVVGKAPDSALPQPGGGPDSSSAAIVANVGSDTARVPWHIQLNMLDTLPIVVELDDDTAHTGTTDRLTVGRARPGATYHWFFPTGTRANVSGRIGDELRLRLSRQADAWIPAADAQPLPAGTPPARAVVGSSTLTPMRDRLVLRVPLSQRIPFLVEESDQELRLRLYSAVGDVDWIRYGVTDGYVRRMAWAQAAADEVLFTIELAGPVWGYRTRWSQNDLILEIRRPPAIDPKHPFSGLLVVVDPGHPPGGATGPTGFSESAANLAVGFKLDTLLRQAGARVVMTRTADSTVDLLPRVQLADSLNADLLISIHNNALPDGVNPFTSNGSSVFYNHPRSIPLALAIQRALVHRFGLRDLGIGRGDLALTRPTWMPAVLCEGLFMIVPDQESALRLPEGQEDYAQAVFEGIEEFLRGTH